MMALKKEETIDEALTRMGVGKFQVILLFIMGVIHCFDSMEMMILVFLGPFLTCYWKISISQSSFLNAGVFVGNIIGLIALGKFSDKNGRKITLIISNLALLYFGLLCSAAPTYYWLIIIRCLTGVALGGNSSSQHTLLSEMTPLKYRGVFMILIQVFWILGSYLITVFSLTFLHLLGWRLLLIFTTIPVFCILLSLIWVPESPRILLLQNNKAQCIEVMNNIAKVNKVEGVSDICQPQGVQKSSFRDLIHRDYFSSTIILCFTMFTTTLSYCCILLISTIINGVPHKCLQDLSTYSKIQVDSHNNTIDDSCCFEITWNSYKNVFIATTGELIILPISLVMINVIGRRITIIVSSFIVSIFIFLLNFCVSSSLIYFFLFVIRGSLSSLLTVIIIYSTEIYPTSVRSLGTGLCGSCGRVGGFFASFLVNVLIAEYSFIGGIMILCILGFVASILCYKLPYETKDRHLFQTADDFLSESTHLYKK